jgi:hypothetical protein
MMLDPYLVGLARDYKETVDTMMNGSGDAQQLDSERLVLHEQILQYTGETRQSIPDMYSWCIDLLHQARAAGLY